MRPVSKARPYAYLGWRAVVAHPLRRLVERGTAEERFLESYATEGLAPTSDEDRAARLAASACISCGLCASACALSGVAPAIRDLGLPAAFRLHSRSAASLAHGADALASCSACTGCDTLCPTGVPITRLVRQLAARALALRNAARRDPAGGER